MMDVKKKEGLIPIPLTNVVTTIPKHGTEMRDLAEDLTGWGVRVLSRSVGICETKPCCESFCSSKEFSGRER